MDGAGQSGTTINLRGLTPGYAAKEGYWLSIEDETGQHYLHNVSETGRADGSGDLILNITPELRWPFEDGATVHLAKPMIEGFVDGMNGRGHPGQQADRDRVHLEEAA